MSESVIVVGGGAIGLAAAWSLARRGAEVLVLERHGHVHELGSHGGYTRIIRQAYHEGSRYISLVREAEDEWLSLGRRRDDPLLVRTGLVEFGQLCRDRLGWKRLDRPPLLDAHTDQLTDASVRIPERHTRGNKKICHIGRVGES